MYVSMWNNLPKYSLSIPLFIFCPRNVSCGIYSEILAFTWKRERHPFSRNYHLFTTLPHRITFLLYPSRRSALKKMFCKRGGFELCGKRGGKPRVGGVEEKKPGEVSRGAEIVFGKEQSALSGLREAEKKNSHCVLCHLAPEWINFFFVCFHHRRGKGQRRPLGKMHGRYKQRLQWCACPQLHYGVCWVSCIILKCEKKKIRQHEIR